METYSVDLANAAAVDAFAQEVLRKHGHIWYVNSHRPSCLLSCQSC